MPFTIRGKVVSGLGEGRKYIALPIYYILITEILDGRPFLGTLNVEIPASFKEVIRSCTPLQIKSVVMNGEEFGGFYYWLGKVRKEHSDKWIKCLLVRPYKSRHPDNIIEVIAEVNLRETLGLKDNDFIEILFACGENSWF
ncbi:MAG: CTP-dependent riboflavin kinase [Desulfurococcales archaeon]|nr:CTP-dependent riboflavin kinase [Desulfurococcales archaeon]